MGIEGSIVGSSAGGIPVSMELLQLIAADPVEFQRRMALIDKSKKDFDDQMVKNGIVGDILALRKEAADAINSANDQLAKAKEEAKKLVSTATAQAEKTVSTAKDKAAGIVAKAEADATDTIEAAKKIMEAAQIAADDVEMREKEAAKMKADADEKYKSVDPDRREYQKQADAAAKAAAEASEAKASLETQWAVLAQAAQQIAKVLGGA